MGVKTMTIPTVPMQLLTSNDETSANLSIMGDITSWPWDDQDSSAMDMSKALANLPSTVSEIFVHINSYGGEVAEGVAIYNALRSHSAKVTTICEGFACSIASVIFMAGDERVMRDSSLLMLHNASMITIGDANDHRKAADDLDVITELSKTAYLNHATESLTREKLDEVMDAETWVTPEQALEWGLATEIDKPEDSDAPSQSARELIMQRLTELPNTQFVTEEQMQRFVERIERIVQKDDDEDEEDEPDTGDEPDTDDDEDEDEDETKQSFAPSRLSQLFAGLSNKQ